VNESVSVREKLSRDNAGADAWFLRANWAGDLVVVVFADRQ